MSDSFSGAPVRSKPAERSSVDQRKLVLLGSALLIAPGLLDALYMEPLYRASLVAYWAADVFQYAILPVMVLTLLIVHGRVQPKAWGLEARRRRHGSLEYLALCLFVCFMYWLTYVPVRYIAGAFFWQDIPSFGNWTAVPQAFWPHLLVVTYYAISAGLVEEVAYRGLPRLYLSRFKFRRGKIALYVLSTSILFGAAHSEQGPQGMIAAFSLGLFAALFYTKCQDLWPFVIAHAVTDFFAFW